MIIGLSSKWITLNQTCVGPTSLSRGAENISSRDPESGCQLEGSSVWFVCGHTVDAALYYTFDADHVYFLSIKRTKMPEL